MLQSAPAETGPWTTQHTISTITLPDTAQVEIGAGGWGGTPTGLTNAVFDNFTYDDGTTPTGGGGGGGDTYTYAYDPAGRRTTVTNSDGTTAFVYDPAGRLISVDDATTTQTRTYDPNGTLIALTATDGVSTQNHALFWDPTGAISELVGVQHRTTGATTLLHATSGVAAFQRGASIDPAGVDWHNSVLDTPAAAGLAAADTYDPYGTPQPQPALGAVTVGFRGELTTGTLVHLRNRDYDPTTGAFTTTDPLDSVIGTTTIANPYHYANNDPIGLHDPLGLRPSDADLSLPACGALGFLTTALTGGACRPTWKATAAEAVGIAVTAGGTTLCTLYTAGAAMALCWAGATTLGGVATRGLDGEATTRAFDPRSVLTDAAIGAVTGGLTAKLKPTTPTPQPTRPGIGRVTSPKATNTVDDLDWSIVKQSTGETRYQHVSAHNVPNIDKASHGVFIDDAVATTDEAWSIVQSTGIQPVTSGGVNVYTIPMGRNVGFAGGANANQLAGVPHTSVQIIVKPGTTQIITAYPVVS